MGHIVIWGMPKYFSTLHHKRHDCRGEGVGFLNIKCVFWFSLYLFPETFLTLRRIRRDTRMIKNVYQSSRAVPVIPVRFERNSHFLDRFSKNTCIKFHEYPSSGSRVIRCGWTDVTKLTAAFRNYANAPTCTALLPKRVSSSARLQGPLTFRTK